MRLLRPDIPPPWLTTGPLLESLGGATEAQRRWAYRQYVEAPVQVGLEDSILNEAPTGLVVGSKQFVAAMLTLAKGDRVQQKRSKGGTVTWLGRPSRQRWSAPSRSRGRRFATGAVTPDVIWRSWWCAGLVATRWLSSTAWSGDVCGGDPSGCQSRKAPHDGPGHRVAVSGRPRILKT
jgi:hypothetical protein